ncbi:MAG: IPT/TIG domain-containing protein, partial [Bacteroidetes bacterium]|nr:IPT/TIG domain-containing protein [Bacteroidota bacterium]
MKKALSLQPYIFFLVTVIPVRLFAQPVISGFSPVSGPAGTSVSITGSGFSTTITSNTVYFGA